MQKKTAKEMENYIQQKPMLDSQWISTHNLFHMPLCLMAWTSGFNGKFKFYPTRRQAQFFFFLQISCVRCLAVQNSTESQAGGCYLSSIQS